MTNVSTCLFCKEICSKQHTYTQKQWETLRLTAKEWSGLDMVLFIWKLIGKKVHRMSSLFFTRMYQKHANSKYTVTG